MASREGADGGILSARNCNIVEPKNRILAAGSAQIGEKKKKTRKKKIDVRVRNGMTVQRIMSGLPELDLVAIKEPCVIMHNVSVMAKGHDTSKLVAWFPELQLVGVVKNTLLPHTAYVHVASHAGIICALYVEHTGDHRADWKLRLAVCNPATGFRLRLPLLKPRKEKQADKLPTELAIMYGTLQVHMSDPGSGKDVNRFRVHVVHGVRDVCTVYTYDSDARAWESSASDPVAHVTGTLTGDLFMRNLHVYAYEVASKSWSGIPTPGKAWNDYPMPAELRESGYAYWLMHPIRCGSRIIMATQCFPSMLTRSTSTACVVMLELLPDAAWSILSWVRCCQFIRKEDPDLPHPNYLYPVPLVCGKLLVFPADVFHVPTAFHLDDHSWLELPAFLLPLPLQTNFVYNPRV